MDAVTHLPLQVRLVHRLAPVLAWSVAAALLGSGYASLLALSFGWRDGLGPLWLVAVPAAVGTARLLRRLPLSAFVLLLAGGVATSWLVPPSRDTLLVSATVLTLAQLGPALLALAWIALARTQRESLAALGLVLAVLAGFQAAKVASGMPLAQTAGQLGVAGDALSAWLIGHALSRRRIVAEAAHAQATAQAVTEERLRIARDVHDMVAHSIGIIAIQAGVAGRVIGTRPAEAEEALLAIEATSREALSGLRRTLVALRRAEPADGRDREPLGPAPGLADLDRLTSAAADGGVAVEVRRLGRPRAVPAEVDLSAYRIVQEAVTNVVRHADAGRCRVVVDYGEEELSVEIEDRGRGAQPGPPGGGFGITGMQERARLLGGRLAAGPLPGGGFRVAAVLPLHDGEPVPVEAR